MRQWSRARASVLQDEFRTSAGEADQPDPLRVLTWRLCSAASSSRCRFAQTSRCSGKVGPKAAMLGLRAASRVNGPALLGLCLALPQRLLSEPHLSCTGHSPADP